MNELSKSDKIKFAIWTFCMILILSILVIATYSVVKAQETVNVPDNFRVINVCAYQGVLETGDQLYLVFYEATYDLATDAPETYTAEDVLLFRLMNGTSELKSSAPYPYFDDGFSYGIGAIYFDSDEISSLGMTWGSGSGYTLRLQGNPLITWNPPSAPHYLATSILYYDDDVEETLALRIRTLANLIESKWDVDLIEGPAGDSYLTLYGEEYFSWTIPNLRDMVPDVYMITTDEPNTYSRNLYADYYMGGDDSDCDLYTDERYAQSFTASDSYYAKAIDFKAFRTGTPTSDLSIAIYESGTLTAPLASGSYPASWLSEYDEGEWELIVFDDSYELTAGTEYTIMWWANGTTSNCISIRKDTNGGYDGGNASFRNTVGVWSDINSGNDDILFCVQSEHGFSQSYRQRMESRLIGTPFDLTVPAEMLGMTRMWLSSMLWIMFTVMVAIIAVKRNSSNRTVNLIILCLQPIGAFAGFLGWGFAIGAIVICMLILIGEFAWTKSTA